MSSERALRVSQAIKIELSDMIRKDIRDERIKGLISVTDVETTSDLSSVRAFISVFGENTSGEDVVECLNEKAGYIRGEICRRLKLRFAPAMAFKLDDSLERGSKVNELLGKISRGEI